LTYNDLIAQDVHRDREPAGVAGVGVADDLAVRASAWLQSLWAQRAVDALAEAGALPVSPAEPRRDREHGGRAGDRGRGSVRPLAPQAQALRARLSRIAGGDALAEACDALADVLAMALLRDRTVDALRSVLDSTRHPVLLTNGARWCLDGNAAASALLGTAREELRLHRLDDFVPRRWRRALAGRWNGFEAGATTAGALLLIGVGGHEITAGYTAASNLAADRHLIVVERIDGVRYGPWLASSSEQREAPILRPREREVLSLVAAGRTSAGIALHLELSRNTVESHIRNAVVRLGAANRTHAVVMALGRGEIALPEPAEPGAA
jgi:DNA-binding CsgD family transcriptional regulator/PAS domain-containing protein